MMSCKISQNDFTGFSKQLSVPSKLRSDKLDDKTLYSFKTPTRPESLVCCPDTLTAQLGSSDSDYRVVNINLKECAQKLWTNLFGNFSIESSTCFDNAANRNFSVNNICVYPGCDFKGDEMLSKKAIRSRSETSKFDHQRPNRRSLDVANANRLKMALKCCIQEKIARPKICDSFLTETHQVLARYPYTDMFFYWEILRAIQVEVDEHKCRNSSTDERNDKKLKQLYMLSYAITRLILQLDFISGGNSWLPFKRSKSWAQALNHFKDDFRDPRTGQVSMNPIPKLVGSLKASFQDDMDQQDACSCLPISFFTRAIGKFGSDGENETLTLRVDRFPDEFTCFDLESLTYLLDNLKCDLRQECHKGISGKCQVDNCPYPVPVRDERVIKEFQLNIRVIEQLLLYLQRTKCFSVKVSPTRPNRDLTCHEKPISPTVRSKSILKKHAVSPEKNIKIEVANCQELCPDCPKPISEVSDPTYAQVKKKNNPRNCCEKTDNCNSVRNNSSPLRSAKAGLPAMNPDSNSVTLCFAEPSLKKGHDHSPKKKAPEPKLKRSRSGHNQCTKEDEGKKSSKVNTSCSGCKVRRKERKKKRRERSNSDRECDFSFRVKSGEEKVDKEDKVEKKKEEKKQEKEEEKETELKSSNPTNEAASTAENSRKEDENVLIMCCTQGCESKGSLVSSVTKMVKKIDPHKPPHVCDPCNELAENYKASKCIEKLRRAGKSNVHVNDCKHKKERIIRLVNLLSSNDCAFQPTNGLASTTASCNPKLDEICELYDKFLALDAIDNCNKKKGISPEESSCVERLRQAFASMNRGKSAQADSTKSSCNVGQKASVGIQASSLSKQSICRGSRPPSKQSVGTAGGMNLASGLPTCAEVLQKVDCNSSKQSVSNKLLCKICSDEDNQPCNKDTLAGPALPGKVCKLTDPKSLETLRRKVESKCKALKKQQEKQKKKKRNCCRCRICRSATSNCNLKGGGSEMKCGSKSYCKSSKSKKGMSCKSKNKMNDSKSACSMRGSKAKCCSKKNCKKVKSCSTEVFASRLDSCCNLDGDDFNSSASKKKQECCSSPRCKKKKSKSLLRRSKSGKSKCKTEPKVPKLKKSDQRLRICETKLKDCDSKLKRTCSKLKKSCSELERCDYKLRKFEAQLKECQSQLTQCDEAKRKLEKCTDALLRRLSQHEDV